MTLERIRCRETTRTCGLASVLAAQGPRSGPIVIGLLVLLVWTPEAGATCWEAAGARYGVHPRLLAAIAHVESGLDPRAVNRAHEARTGTVDLGLMQINSSWVPLLARHGITREALFDACTSVTVGAWILAGLFARHGVTWEAIGAYNASCTRLAPAECAARRAGYARKVEAALRALAGAAPVELARTDPVRILQLQVREAAAVDESATNHESRGGER